MTNDRAVFAVRLNPLFHDRGLCFADGSIIGMDLSVQIAFGNDVMIDQDQSVDPAACQCFGSKRTNPADADDHNGCMTYSLHAFFF